MENSNRTKQLIAIIIALAIFIASGWSTLNSTKVDEEVANSFYDSYLMDYFKDGLIEEVIEGTNAEERLAVIPIYGVITEDAGGIIGSEYDHQLILSAIKQIQTDPTVQGVLLDVDSPGGGVYESEQVYTRLKELKKAVDIPIFTTMRGMGASGGYYIPMASDQIFASPETVTGSIGVIMGGLNFSELFDKWGIEDQTITTGKFKDTGSATRPMDAEEKRYQEDYIDRAFQRFVEVVAQGRGMDQADVLKVAEGKIYDGLEAQELGLIDEIGYFDEALESLKQTTDLEDPQVFHYTRSGSGRFLSSMIDAPFFKQETATTSSMDLLMEVAEQLNQQPLSRPMYLLGGD